jgi:hypothetical protein
MINAIQYIARYIRLLKRHNALLALHASTSRGFNNAFIGIATRERFVRFKLRGTHVVMETARNNIKNFDSTNNILFTEELEETYKSTVFSHDVKQFGMADKWKLYEAVGATVVAPSDFQSERHQKPNNQ